jgi:hypothetical protein
VTVDLDTLWDQAPETPTAFWTTSATDNTIAAAIAATPTPDTLPGTLWALMGWWCLIVIPIAGLMIKVFGPAEQQRQKAK